MLRITVLQFFFMLNVRTRTKTISTPIVIQKQIRAYFKEVNLKTFMAAMIMLTAMMSLMIQFLLENHQAKQTMRAIPKLAKSRTRTEIYLTLNNSYLNTETLLSRKRDQLVQSQTAAIPNPQESTLTAISTTSNLKTATMPPTLITMLKNSTRGRPIRQPAPPMDQALEQRAVMVIKSMQKAISMKSPHSKLVPSNQELHRTQQETTKSRVEKLSLTTSKQLKQFNLGRGQLFLTSSRQGKAVQVTDWLLLSWALMELYSVVIVVVIVVLVSGDVIVRLQTVLFLYWLSDWLYVNRGLREQLKPSEYQKKLLFSIGLPDLLYTVTVYPATRGLFIVITYWHSDGIQSSVRDSKQSRDAWRSGRPGGAGDAAIVDLLTAQQQQLCRLYIFTETITQQMDQRSNSSDRHHTLDGSKHHQALQSLKNSLDYIGQLFKMCHCNFKPYDEHMSLVQSCHFVEKMLRKLVNLVPKNMVTLDMHNRVVRELDQVNDSYQAVLKDHRDYKCEINVLETQLAEAEKREQALLDQKDKQKKYTKGFQRKLGEVQRYSQSKLEKETSIIINSEDIFKSRKKSLPTIINNGYSQRVKPRSKNSLHLLAMPTQDQKTLRLVEHLRKKY